MSKFIDTGKQYIRKSNVLRLCRPKAFHSARPKYWRVILVLKEKTKDGEHLEFQWNYYDNQGGEEAADAQFEMLASQIIPEHNPKQLTQDYKNSQQ